LFSFLVVTEPQGPGIWVTTSLLQNSGWKQKR
jgi:hypothetical protein